MNTAPRKPGSDSIALPLAGGVVVIVGLAYATVQLASFINEGVWVPGNPLKAVWDTARNYEQLGAVHIVIGVVLLLLAIGLFVVILDRAEQRRLKRASLDAAAKHMGKGLENSLAAAEKRTSVGSLAAAGIAVGLRIAQAVANQRDVYAAWRDGMVVLMGPGGGKTSAVAIPLIYQAPGNVVVTSNKRDIADAIVRPRGRRGQVWTFDCQNIADYHKGGLPTWWWNPLSYVKDEVKAQNLAKLFATSSRPLDAKTDAYFDSAGQNLVAGLLLAAAVGKRPITQVYLWLQDNRDDTPADLLDNAGYVLPGAMVRSFINLPADQKAGVFGTAIMMVNFLNNRQIEGWICSQGPDDNRPQFSPEAFVRAAADTLISLSKEGNGSAGPLTAALTVAVTEAAEEFGKESKGGRLPVPIVAVLDEAANVCRWDDLPNQYSHYGSRGIFLCTILQNWAQGERAWTKAGMLQMWSAATIRLVGSGLSDPTFLEHISKEIGEKWENNYTRGTSSGTIGRPGTSNRNTSQQRVRILTIDDLTALPQGRAIFMAAQARPVLVKTIPWWEIPEVAELVKDSIANSDPAHEKSVA